MIYHCSFLLLTGDSDDDVNSVGPK
jgi:hypothetical protein